MKQFFLSILIALVAVSSADTVNGQSLVGEGAKVEKLAGGMRFTEVPVWLPAGKKLVFSDIPNSKLMQWSAAEGLSVFQKSEQANGNILDLEGRIISCQHAARNLVRIDAKGKLTVLADKFDGKRRLYWFSRHAAFCKHRWN